MKVSFKRETTTHKEHLLASAPGIPARPVVSELRATPAPQETRGGRAKGELQLTLFSEVYERNANLIRFIQNYLLIHLHAGKTSQRVSFFLKAG